MAEVRLKGMDGGYVELWRALNQFTQTKMRQQRAVT